MTNSCSEKHAFSYINHKTLDHFPSGSAIEIFDNKLYLLGDDSKQLFILDTSYNLLDSITYINDSNYRIPKDVKPDVESASILRYGDEVYLYGFGSMSTSHRKLLYSFPLNADKKVIKSSFSLPNLDQIKEWNIEGAALVNDMTVFANRGNQNNKKNYLIINNSYQTNRNSQRDGTGSTTVIELELPGTGLSKGVSGLYYLKEKDILFFTASEENTNDAYTDGTIGNSYLGWIINFSRMVKRINVEPTLFIPLNSIHTDFNKQKVESICIQKLNKNLYNLHLVADNDEGKSELFKLRLWL